MAGVEEEKLSIESNLTGGADRKFLTGQVMVGKAKIRSIFALSEPCPLFHLG